MQQALVTGGRVAALLARGRRVRALDLRSPTDSHAPITAEGCARPDLTQGVAIEATL
jgi:hypothetical protein